MSSIPDEMLMAFADGRLDAETHTRIARAIESDGEARRRLDAFLLTGPRLAQAVEGLDLGPVPQRLVDCVMTAPIGGPASREAKPARLRHRLGTWLSRTLGFEGSAGTLAFALSVMLLAGVVSIWRVAMPGGAAEPMRFTERLADGRLAAVPALARALETVASGNTASLGTGGAILKAEFTFKSKAGAYCRQYQLQNGGESGLLGIACRTDGAWAVAAEENIAARSLETGDQYKSASGPLDEAGRRRIDKRADAISGGLDIIAGKAEQALIESGWSGYSPKP